MPLLHIIIFFVLQEDDGELALKSKGIENLVSAVAGMSDQEKESMSYSQAELVVQCSFNGHDCDMEK